MVLQIKLVVVVVVRTLGRGNVEVMVGGKLEVVIIFLLWDGHLSDPINISFVLNTNCVCQVFRPVPLRAFLWGDPAQD